MVTGILPTPNAESFTNLYFCFMKIALSTGFLKIANIANAQRCYQGILLASFGQLTGNFSRSEINCIATCVTVHITSS